ncbi:MAG: divergent polysaccharide deacetylase family protein [Myxococcales bacterium]|nr:divergent polysaccharide deacetylase family protein [Myxococcales bacterium]
MRRIFIALGALISALALAIAVVAVWPAAPRGNAALARWGGAARAAAGSGRGVGGLCSPASPCLALVIDDIGRDMKALEQLLALDMQLTFSVLPHARHTAAAVKAIRRRRRQLMLHLPMEPLDRAALRDEPIVLSSSRPIVAPLEDCLSRVPGLSAVNNHMGSAMSADASAMAPLLRHLAGRGLPFLDSRTSPHTQICRVARRVGVMCLERDVFLDDPPRPATFIVRLAQALRVARRRGWAVAIGHPHPVTVAQLSKLSRSEVSFPIVPLSHIVASGVAVARRNRMQ